MRRAMYLFAAVAAVSVLASCQKEESFRLGSKTMGVSVNAEESEDVRTKSSADDEGAVPYVFEVNGEELALRQVVSKMTVEAAEPETKGSVVSGSGDSGFGSFTLTFRNADDSEDAERQPVNVSYSDGKWTLADARYWPESSSTPLKFYASNRGSAGSTQTVTETFPSDGGVKIEYSDAGSDGSAATSETDLLYAYTKTAQDGGIQRTDDTAIGLTFHHALAGLKFNFGTITSGVKLTNVTLSGITTSGECLYKDDSFEEWTLGTDKATLSQSFEATATDSSAGTSCDDAEGTRTFFIIPQDIADDAEVALTFEYSLSAFSKDPIKSDEYGDSTVKTFTTTLSLKDIAAKCSSPYTSWEAGSLYTYTISGTLVFAELGYTIPTICTSILSPAVEASAVNSVIFSVGEKPATKGTLVTGPEVQSSRSLTKIYATYDSGSNELTLHTTAPKIFAPKNSGKLFYGLTSMTGITGLTNLDTENVTAMNLMFGNCLSVTSLDVTKFDTSNVTNMLDMFFECESLSTLDVSNFDTSNVTNMGEMFRDCYKLPSINVSNFNTSKVQDMHNMFEGCKSFTSLNVSNFNTANVTKMSEMFERCTSLTSLNLSNFNTAKVTNMSAMFQECSAMTSLTLGSNFTASKTTYMNNMFASCSSLKTLDLSNFNTAAATNMSYMFQKCSAMTSLTLGSNFTAVKTTTMSYMFENCSSLKTLDLSNFNTAAATIMSYMFQKCSAMTSLTLGSNFTTVKATDTRSMFNGCSSLTTLDVSTFHTANVKNMSSMFAGCSAMTSLKLDVDNFNTAKVTTMASMFNGCKKLATLDVSKFNTSNVTTMKQMFFNCHALTTLDVSGFNTEKVTDMSNMFYTCKAVTSLDVSGFNTAKVTDMSQMFFACHVLTSLNVSGFDTSNVTNMKNMFKECKVLTSLDLSNFNTASVTDMTSMLASCHLMKSLTLGANFTLAATTTKMFDQFAGKVDTSAGMAQIHCSSALATAITNDAGNNLIDTSKVEFATA